MDYVTWLVIGLVSGTILGLVLGWRIFYHPQRRNEDYPEPGSEWL